MEYNQSLMAHMAVLFSTMLLVGCTQSSAGARNKIEDHSHMTVQDSDVHIWTHECITEIRSANGNTRKIPCYLSGVVLPDDLIVLKNNTTIPVAKVTEFASSQSSGSRNVLVLPDGALKSGFIRTFD
jgi:hypothetical protein